MQSSIDSRKQRKKDALISVLFYTVLQVLSAFLMLWIRQRNPGNGTLQTILLLLTLLTLGMLIPIWISFKNRIHEIQGGEEDVAAEY